LREEQTARNHAVGALTAAALDGPVDVDVALAGADGIVEAQAETARVLAAMAVVDAAAGGAATRPLEEGTTAELALTDSVDDLLAALHTLVTDMAGQVRAGADLRSSGTLAQLGRGGSLIASHRPRKGLRPPTHRSVTFASQSASLKPQSTSAQNSRSCRQHWLAINLPSPSLISLALCEILVTRVVTPSTRFLNMWWCVSSRCIPFATRAGVTAATGRGGTGVELGC